MIPNFEKAIDALKANDNFLVATHVNADGDAISSTLALSYILKSLNKKSVIILNEPPDEKYKFLAGFSEIKTFDSANDIKYKAVITVDVPTLSRLGSVKKHIADDAFIINIDHHFDNDSFGSINIIDADASSSAEVVRAFAKRAEIPFSKELAEMIYTGIIYDTGMFRFSSTTELAYAIGAEAKKAGARIDKIAHEVFFTKDYETITLLAQTLCAIRLFEGGKVGVMTITKKELQKLSRKPDMDDYVNYLMMLKGIEVGIFLTELEENYYRVSLRSQNDFDVRKVAATFFGGGHKKAAGCKIKGSADEIVAGLLAEIRKTM